MALKRKTAIWSCRDCIRFTCVPANQWFNWWLGNIMMLNLVLCQAYSEFTAS